MHPRQRRCSSFKYSRYSQSSRLAGGAPRSSRCDARRSPPAAKRARGGCASLPVQVVLTMTPQDVLHAVLELELFLLEGDFFELFEFGEVMLDGQFVQAIFELVVLRRKLMELLVGPQQLILGIMRLCIH